MSEHIDQIEQVTQTELLEQESSEETVKESANKARPLIEVQHLTKKFGDLTVLDDISESIGDGEKVVIIGPSGGGKSTFLRCLNVLEDLLRAKFSLTASIWLTSKWISTNTGAKWAWCSNNSICLTT